MRVAEIVAPQRFSIVERPVPEPGPGEALVRVHSVGVCGSDLHWFTDEGVGANRIQYPSVLGHEPTGTIAATGAGVTGWSPGDRVALEPALYCYHCEFCLTGHHNVCAAGKFMSSSGEPGFYREYVTIPASNLLPLPPAMGLPDATLFEPLAVILNAMEMVALQPGETAAIYGAGPIGLMMLSMLKLSGAGTVWCVEPAEGRRDLARQLGADAVIDPNEIDPVRQIRQDTGGRGVDVSIDCATKDDTINQSLYSTRNAGRVIILGIYTGLRIALDLHFMRSRELTLRYVHRSKHQHGHLALEILAAHPARFGPMLTHNLDVAGIQRGFQMLEDKSDNVGKLLISL